MTSRQTSNTGDGCKINKMNDNLRHIPLSDRSPLFHLIISLVIVFGIGFFLMTIVVLAGIWIFGIDLTLLQDLSKAETVKDIGFIRYLLAAQEVSLFILPALIILTKVNPVPGNGRRIFNMPAITDIALVVLLAFCIFPVTSFTGQLNSSLDLPECMSGIEQWMVEKEKGIGEMFDLIATPDSFGVMIGNIFVIALLPAIGEELIFRGVFQRILGRLFKSGYVAIWVTAFVFSAVHFQFFGFLPRFILGLIFGYLFFWSGTIWLPVIAHFVNNAVSVIGAYIYGSETSSAPAGNLLLKELSGLVVPVLIGTIILIYFRNKNKKFIEATDNNNQVTIM